MYVHGFLFFEKGAHSASPLSFMEELYPCMQVKGQVKFCAVVPFEAINPLLTLWTLSDRGILEAVQRS